LVLGSLWPGRAEAQSVRERPETIAARERMVQREIIEAGVKNERVIESMRGTPRHEFVGSRLRPFAYFDMALPIGEGQTISPPFVVAYMTEALDPAPEDKVLEIGTGSGYQAAVLSPLVKEVYTIEIVEPLGRTAAGHLRRLRYENVFTRIGDGYLGWPEKAPFDKIIVTCSPENVPKPLVEQLAEGGRMVIPVGERYQQTLYLYRKREGELVEEKLLPTLFVPMTGKAEEQREKLPDGTQPAVVNSGFEEAEADGVQAKGWHYQRQSKLVSDAMAPEGTHYLELSNREPSRGAQVLQGMAIDGRAVGAVELSLFVQLDGISTAGGPRDVPMVVLTYYDERRAEVGAVALGPWVGTFAWERVERVFPVPPLAREAILRISLHGATGTAGFDDVRLVPLARF
jgi:protein-L-isoaspartate(D-aspartate) O-methyltransferase